MTRPIFSAVLCAAVLLTLPLAAAENDDDFVTLFDGTDLDRWINLPGSGGCQVIHIVEDQLRHKRVAMVTLVRIAVAGLGRTVTVGSIGFYSRQHNCLPGA